MKTQSFPDGVVKIYTVTEISTPGDMPVEGLALKASLRFKQRTLGFNRVYVESQNDIQVDNLIRCPLLKTIEALDVAVINGDQYRVKRIQEIEDTRPRVMDLTLERLDGGLYDV